MNLTTLVVRGSSSSRRKHKYPFLKKKETPDKPFFTIELTNNEQIRQIHGFANCDITTVDILPRLRLWLRGWGFF